MYVDKPIMTSGDIWGKDVYGTDKMIESSENKIYTGWTYEDRPSFQEWNAFWYNIMNRLYETAQYSGIPPWESEVKYITGSYVVHLGQEIPYHCISVTPDNEDPEEPQRDSRRWRSHALLNSLRDVHIDLVKDNEAVVYYHNTWINARLSTYPLNVDFGMHKFDDFDGIECRDDSGRFYGAPLKEEKYLLYKEGSKFISKTLDDVSTELDQASTDFSIYEDLDFTAPANNDIIWFDNSLDKYIITNKDILAEPDRVIYDEELVPKSADTDFGGVKIWMNNGDLHIDV